MKKSHRQGITKSYTDQGCLLLLAALLLSLRGTLDAGSTAIHLRDRIAAGHPVRLQPPLP